MLKTILTSLVLVIPGVEIIAAELTRGKAECAPRSAGHACSIQWDFVRSPRAFYQVEYLDENSLQWRAAGQPYGSFRTRSEPVPAARLYRVRGCDDETVQRNCVFSTVHWAISRPLAKEIPAILIDGDGVEMHIVKNGPIDAQIAQYNVYRLIQLLDRIPDISRLPPMTEPRAPRKAEVAPNDDFQILTGIYENYTERRLQAMRTD